MQLESATLKYEPRSLFPAPVWRLIQDSGAKTHIMPLKKKLLSSKTDDKLSIEYE